MKKFYVLAMLCISSTAFGQIEGTWKLADIAGALAVGPTQGDGSWWSNSVADVTGRACLFDDSVTFDNTGGMVHQMDGSTWLEPWQGVGQEECGAPVAPHDGQTNAPYTYNYDSQAGTLTVNGVGAHMGLPKAINGGELTDPTQAPASVTYLVAFSNNDNTMTLDIDWGTGWWRFVYNKTNAAPPAPANITFQVDMSEYTGSTANGVFLNGGFNGWCGNCNPMTDIGNNIWELTLPLANGTIQYKFTVDGWTDQETIDSLSSCVDGVDDGFFNRELTFTGDTTLPAVCWSACTACTTNNVNEVTLNTIGLYPNPVNDIAIVTADENIETIVVLDVNGKAVNTVAASSDEVEINVAGLPNGVYMVQVTTVSGLTQTIRLIKE